MTRSVAAVLGIVSLCCSLAAVAAVVDRAAPKSAGTPQMLSVRTHDKQTKDCLYCPKINPQQGPHLPSEFPSVTLVIARYQEDTSWADVYLGKIPHVVYQAADPNAQFTTSFNKGNEAAMYLQYILDHYDKLPDIVLFTHGAK